MTSSTVACDRDVDQHLASDHELHSTSIPCDVGDTTCNTTSGLAANDRMEDMSVSDLWGRSSAQPDLSGDSQTAGRMDTDVSSVDSRYLRDVTDGLIPAAKTLDDDVTRSQNIDDNTPATTSRHSSTSFSSSSDTLTSSSVAVSHSYMHLRSR